MTKLQRIQTRLSESREKANSLSLKTDRSKEEEKKLVELRKAHSKLELEYRETLESTPETNVVVDDAETRELDGLILKASVGDVLHAALDQRSTDGATAELQTHFGLTSNQIALEQLERRAVTVAPSDVGQTQAPIIPQIFPDGVASFLGIGMETVGVGEATYHGIDHGRNRPHSSQVCRRRGNDGFFLVHPY